GKGPTGHRGARRTSRRPAHRPRALARRHGPRGRALLSPGEHRAELAEDPGSGAPDVYPVDPVAPIAERPVADRPLDDLDRRIAQEGGDRRFEDPGHLVG